jgi:hypothetical protein
VYAAASDSESLSNSGRTCGVNGCSVCEVGVSLRTSDHDTPWSSEKPDSRTLLAIRPVASDEEIDGNNRHVWPRKAFPALGRSKFCNMTALSLSLQTPGPGELLARAVGELHTYKLNRKQKMPLVCHRILLATSICDAQVTIIKNAPLW